MTTKANYFHAVVIFNSEENYEEIEKYFAEVLEYENSENYAKDRNWKNISKDFGNKKIDIVKLQLKLAKFDYLFIPHENKEKGLTKYLGNESTQNQEYKKRLFYYNSMGLDGRINKNQEINKHVKHKIYKEIASFTFTDREKFTSKWTWIQFDKTFNGLLTAITDPNERIISCTKISDNPQENYSSHISKITFEQKGDKTEVLLHPGYNAVIGTRGSGKSTLAQILKGESDLLRQRGIKDINHYYRENLKIIETNQIAYFEQGKFSQFFSDSTEKSPNQIKYLKDKEEDLVKKLEEKNNKTLALIELKEKEIKEIYEKYSSKGDSISRTRKLYNSFKWSEKQKSILNNIDLNINSEKHESNKLQKERRITHYNFYSF